MHETLFLRAKKVIPGGVHSPVRAFKAVGGTPRYLIEGHGPWVEDVDGERYVDYVGSFGACILGHAHPQVIAATQSAIQSGLGFSAPHPLGVTLAEKICSVFPAMDQVRFVNSGTEACQTALRLARGATGRDKVIKFAGCYHGHIDALLVEAGSGGLTLGVPNSAGVTAATTQDTLSLPYNDLSATQACFERYGEQIAAVMVEPIAGNMGCILPQDGFLQGLRDLCDQWGALLIFDEVMSGFRVAWGGAQLVFNIAPDLTTLGKVIGGGLPVGGIGGKQQWMRFLAPEGPVYQAGTLSGNPITLSAGMATLEVLEAHCNAYDTLGNNSDYLLKAVKQLADEMGIAFSTTAMGGMMGCFLSERVPTSLADIAESHITRFPLFFHTLLANGVYWPPSAYEAAFVSLYHDEQAMNRTIEAFKEAFISLKGAL